MKKRVLSLFMALALCLSMAPTVSFAEATGAVTGQEAQSGESTADVYIAGNETTGNGINNSDVSGNDVSNGDAYDANASEANANDANADEQDAEKDAAVQAAQALIDALPDEATAENADELQAQLIAIDEALAELTDEQIAGLDMARYESICAALTGLVAVQADVHENHPICGATCNHKDESGAVKHTAVTWTAINSADDIKNYSMAAGYYYLTADVELKDTWWIYYNIVLCLNGHSITLNGTSSVISVSGGTFTLCDCNGSANGKGIITHGKQTDGATTYTGNGISVDRGEINMYGGTISGNSSSSYGGGVYVTHSYSTLNTFNMYGGTITNNSAANGGGGVYVNNSTFHMHNGTISNNTITRNGGGGVYVEGSTFTMQDGNISNNTAAEGSGGGVYMLDGGNFTMTGGTISDNTSYQGGGVYLETDGSNTFIMEGGSITQNTATKNGNNAGGGVYVTKTSNFTVSGAVQITGNKDKDGKANNVYLDNYNPEIIKIAGELTGGKGSIGVTMFKTLTEGTPNTFATAEVTDAGENYELTEGDAACFSSDQGYFPYLMGGEVKMFVYEPQVHPICGNSCEHGGVHQNVVWIGISELRSIQANGNYYLVDNIIGDGDYVTTYYDVNLCLHGHTYSGGLRFQSKNYTLCDCKGEVKITGSSTQHVGIELVLGGKLDMYGALITKNGIGVHVENGTLNMYGGKITENSVGVHVENGTFNMYDGEITGNSYTGVDGYAAGVRVDADGTFNMYGNTKISGNTASFMTREKTSGYYGAAGVYVNGGTFTMTENAEVSNNTLTTEGIGESANNYAGGVYVKNGNVIVGGNVKITENKKGENTSNVCLPKDQIIKVSEKLNADAIGVITETPITVVGEEAIIAEGTASYPLTETDKNAFSSDDNIPVDFEDGKIIFREGVHKHYICGKADCSEDSHGHAADVKWTAISTLSEINGDGYYFLTKDVELDGTWVCDKGNNVELCLNGKKIICNMGAAVITVASGASLVITDCQESVGKITHPADVTDGSGIYVKGSLTLWNGSITGNKHLQQGAVHVEAGGTFTMNGGSIAENKTNGGVHVAGGEFYMNGGKITLNTDGYGGVYVESGEFTMTGGDITQNTSEFYSGGVYVADGGKFYMKGGNITENTGKNSGGVYASGTFTMSGGKITENENSVANSGGGVYVYYGTFNMTGGEITGNTNTVADGGGGVYVGYLSTFTMTGGEIIGNTNSAANGGGGVYVASQGKFNMTDGEITGNTNSAENGGGGVYVASNGEFTMNGGEITGNNTTSTDDSCAGGVFIDTYDGFTVSGAAQITGNWKNGTKAGSVYGKGEGSTASNVYLSNDYRVITIGEELTQDAKIGVSVSTGMLPTEGYAVEIAENATKDQNYYRNIFSLDSEDPYYSIIRDEYNCLYIHRHKHDWKYSASGVTLTAKCEAEDCPVKDGDGGSITIVAPENPIYDSNSKVATFEYKLLDEVGIEKDRIWIEYAEGSVSDNTSLGAGVWPVNAGTYTASIRLEYANGTKSDPAVVEYTIKKADPVAENFGFTKPEDLVYNDTVKEVEGVWYRYNGIGKFTVRYLDANKAEVEPRNVGTYTVVIDVTEGTNYNAATGLTADSWTFTITPITAQPTVGLSGDWTYTGKQITPLVLVKESDTDRELVEGTDYTVIYGENINAGSLAGTVTIKAKGNYAFEDIKKFFTIDQAKPELSFEASDMTKTYIDEPFTNPLTNKGDGKVTYTSSEASVATVDKNGQVTIVGVGETTITATAAETQNYEADTTSYTLTVDKAEIHITEVIVSLKYYDGDPIANVFSISFADKQGNPVSDVLRGTDYNATGTYQDVNVGGQLVDVEVELLDDFAKKYVLEATTCVTSANIEARPIRIGSANAENRDYKKGDTSVTINSVTLLDKDGNPWTMLKEGTDYTVSGEMADANAGTNKDVTVTVKLSGNATRNYRFSDTGTTTTTTKTTVTINQVTPVIKVAASELTLMKNDIEEDISKWVSFDNTDSDAELTYELVGKPTGITLTGSMLKAANNDSTVNSFTIKVTAKATTNFTAPEEKIITVKVVEKNDAGVSITNAPASKTYGDGSFTLTADKTAPDGGTWSWSSSNDSVLKIVSGVDTDTPTIKVMNAGSAILTVTYTSDTYYGFASVTITVAAKEITAEMIAAIPAQDYIGKYIEPTPEVKDGEMKLIPGTDFDYSYSDNFNASDKATLTVTGKGNYTGTASKEFTILPKSIDGATIVLEAESFEYNGTERMVNIISVTLEGWSDPIVYKVVGGVKATNANDSITLTISGRGNYTGTATATWKITRIDPKLEDFDVTGLAQNYDGTAKTVTVTAKSGINGMGDVTVKYDGSTEAPINAGSYTVTMDVNNGSNYNDMTDIAVGTLTIQKATPVITATTAQTIVKNGVAVDISGWASTDNTDNAALTYELVGTPAGITLTGNKLTATKEDTTVETFDIRVTAAATMNFNVPAEKTITVTVVEKADAGVSITDETTDKTYGDKDFTLKATKTAPDGGTWSWSSTDSGVLEIVSGADTDTPTIKVKKVGSAILTATYTSDTHYGSANVTITVAAKKVTTDMIAAIQEQEYTGSAIEPTPEVKDGGAKLIPGTDFDYSYSGNINAGTATLTITGKGNYTGTAEKTFTISPKSINGATIGLDVKSFTYNGSEQTVNITSVTLEGWSDTITYEIVSGDKATNASDSITLTISGRGNYDGTATTTWKITRIDPKLEDFEVTGLTTALTYDGTAKSVTVTAKFGISGMGDITVKYNGSTEAPTNAGSYAVTMDVNNGSNYNDMTDIAVGTLTINKAAAPTLEDIREGCRYTLTGGKTVDLAELVAGATNYTLGEAAGDTEILSAYSIDADGILKYTLTGTGKIGDTVTLPVTITSANYEDAAVKVIITLKAKDDQEALLVTGDNTVVYGGKLTLGTTGGSGTGEVTYSIDTENSTGEATIDTNGVLTPVKVGSITILATKAGDVDYNEITSAPFVITITPATPTGEPKYIEITTEGQTLADAGLTLIGSSISLTDGTLEWIDDNGNALSGDTKVEVNKTYKWRFTPTDTNYEILTGEIELYHVDLPAITSQPKNVSVKAGERAVFEVTATGTDVTYQWQIDRNDGKGFVNLNGATSATYTSGVTDADCNGFKYQCVIRNAAGSVTTDTVTLTITEEVPPTPEPVQYRIISGADSAWTQNTDGSLVISGDGEFAKFQNVLVDGKVIGTENYTAAEGSTIITLKADFLSTLSEGSHSIEIVWADGSASTHFTVARNTSGDNNSGDNNGNNNDGNSGSNNSNNNNSNDNSNNAGSGDHTTDDAASAIAPKTGDASKDALWMVLLVVASIAGLAGAAEILAIRKKNNGK